MLSAKNKQLFNKYIKESLNEKFEDESDPIVDMGIGAEYDIWLEDNFKPFLEEYQEKYYSEKNMISVSGMKKCFQEFKEDIEPLIDNKFVEGTMWKTKKGWVNMKIKVLEIRGSGSKTLFHPMRNALSYFQVKGLYYSNLTGNNMIDNFSLYLKKPYHVTSRY
jgi:hypothetical protein